MEKVTMLLIDKGSYVREQLFCLDTFLQKRVVVLFFYILIVGFAVMMPITCHGETFMSAKLSASALEGDHFPSNEKNGTDTSGAGYALSVGHRFNEWFAIEGCYTDHNDQDEYKIGELDGLASDIIKFLDPIFFGALSTDIVAKVDMRVKTIGANAIGSYKWFYIQAGISQWRSNVDISIPGEENVSYSDSGYGYGYGGGVQFRFGKHWRLLLQQEKHRYDDISGVITGLGVNYTF